MRSKSVAALVVLLVVALLAGLPSAPISGAKSRKGTSDREHLGKREELVRTAIRHLRMNPKDVRVTDFYTSNHNKVTHVFLRQVVNGSPVIGAEATVNLQKGKVIFSGERFVDPDEVTGEPLLDPLAALQIAESSVRESDYDVFGSPVLNYRVLDDHSVRLVYDVQIVTELHWWVVSVDAENGNIVHRLDLVDHDGYESIVARTARHEDARIAKAIVDPVFPPKRANDGSAYRVFPMPMESPYDGRRIVVHNPADALASPFGWHDVNGVHGPEYTITRGNNVHAYTDTVNDQAPDPRGHSEGGRSLNFRHDIPTYEATPFVYREAAIDNLFYWNNVMHDVTFRYGFNEEAGNFQASNYTGQGRGGDEVQAEAQDGSGALNANFSTPEEGIPGRMQMYLWVDVFTTLGLAPDDVVRVYNHQVRDGDLDGGVIAHEYGHGISNRLVGGPDNVQCLRTHDEREGEGWSDFWSYALTMRPKDDGKTPRGIGTYVVYHDGGREDQGIRITPYSTDMKINPSTYDTIKNVAEPHGVGYVWATMLWDLYWNLVDKHGFNPNPYEGWRTGGNNLAIQLVVDGMKFAPCEPGFEDARDAIIAADAALTGNPAKGIPGDNECLIWRTFARRGLGINAKQGDFESKVDGVNGFKVPAHCK